MILPARPEFKAIKAENSYGSGDALEVLHLIFMDILIILQNRLHLYRSKNRTIQSVIYFYIAQINNFHITPTKKKGLARMPDLFSRHIIDLRVWYAKSDSIKVLHTLIFVCSNLLFNTIQLVKRSSFAYPKNRPF